MPAPRDRNSIDELFAAALEVPDADLDDEAAYEFDQQRWSAIGKLQDLADTDVLKRAQRLCESHSSWERRVGIDILAKVGTPEQPFSDQRLQSLLALLEGEEDPGCLESAAIALGHLRRPEGLEPLLRMVEYPDRLVRYGVVHGLLAHQDARAVLALVRLSHDPDDLVREWATFELRNVELDTDEVLSALRARLDDEDIATRIEAVAGLADRADRVALEPLLRTLNEAAEFEEFDLWAHGKLVEAAFRSLLGPLTRSRDRFGNFGWLEEALDACTDQADGQPNVASNQDST